MRLVCDTWRSPAACNALGAAPQRGGGGSSTRARALSWLAAIWLLLPQAASAQPTPTEVPDGDETGAGAQPAPPDAGAAGTPEPAPLLVPEADAQADAPAPAEKGQQGHELRDARYRVDTTVAKIKRKRRRGVRAPGDARVGLTLSGGGLLTPGLSQGWYGRIDGTALSGYAGDWHSVYGVLAGFEYWSASNGSGGGVPAAFRVGLVGPLSQFAIDLGAETLIFDDRDDDFGFGIYAPFARALLGFDFGDVALLIDSQVQYRWQWGADDFTDYRLGASLSLLGEPPTPPPKQKSR